MTSLLHPPKARPGDRVAVLSPSFAAPAVGPAVHERAMERLTELTGLVPVEYPTTRRLGAYPRDRAADLMAAFADPSIRAVLATVGGDDQVRVVGHLDPEVARADPKPFLGYSDNTNLLAWLHAAGVAAFHGGSTQVHLGAGPSVDAVHLASLRAALLTGDRLEVTEPGESEDFGPDWASPEALTQFGEREPAPAWVWSGPRRVVTGPTWGGNIEVLAWVALAGRLTVTAEDLAGGVLLVETSEEVPPPHEVARNLEALAQRGLLEAVEAVVLARPATSNHEHVPSAEERAAHRGQLTEAVCEVVTRHNDRAVVVSGVPFGHTRPHWILPFGGRMTIDGEQQRVWADYA